MSLERETVLEHSILTKSDAEADFKFKITVKVTETDNCTGIINSLLAADSILVQVTRATLTRWSKLNAKIRIF